MRQRSFIIKSLLRFYKKKRALSDQKLKDYWCEYCLRGLIILITTKEQVLALNYQMIQKVSFLENSFPIKLANLYLDNVCNLDSNYCLI